MAKRSGTVGFLGAFSIGIGGIVGGGIFATLGLAAIHARGATYLSFLIGGAVALLTAYAYVHLSLTFPSKGGTVIFVNRAFGSGIFAGGMNTLLVLSYVVLLAVYAYAFATYASTFFPKTDYTFWHRVLTSSIVVVLAVVNFVGPGLVDRSEGSFNLGKLLILLIFVVVGMASRNLTFERLTPADWVAAPVIVASGMLVFISYEGFELIANVSDLVRNPGKNLRYAFYGSVATAIVFYMFIIVVALGHLSFDALSEARDYSLSAAAKAFMGQPGFILLAIGAMLATASAINAGIFGASKLPVMLAQEHEAPERYGREVWGRHPLGLGTIVVLTLMNLANAKLADKTKSRRWISVVGAIACLGALAIMLVQIARDPQHSFGLHFIAGLVIFPFLYQLVYRTFRRTRDRTPSTAGALPEP
jgi:uncharacterized protein